MKRNMRKAVEKIWALRGLLVVCFMVTILYGVSFVSHADEKGNIVGSDVNMRQTASTTATVLEVLNNNALVDVIAETTGDDGNKWYKITSAAGNTGYVRSDFVKKATVTVPVTDTEDKTAYILGNSANIRQDASTSSGRVANAAGGSKITIIGEATGADGYTWYQVSFDANGTTMTGFIRADLITFQAPTQAPEVTEIEGEMGEGSEPEASDVPESEEPSEQPSEAPSESEGPKIPVESSADDLDIMEPESSLEILPAGFEQTELTLGEDVFTVWGKGNFYIVYASAKGGEPQYYLYDSVNKGYVAYSNLLSSQDVATPQKEEGPNYKLISFVCIGVIVLLIIVIFVLAYKLSNAGYRDDDEEDDDDDDNDDIYDDDDEYVDLSDEDDVEIPTDLGEPEDIINEQVLYESSYGTVSESAYEEQNEVPVGYEAPVYVADVYEMPVNEGTYEVPVEMPADEGVYAESAESYAGYTAVREPIYAEEIPEEYAPEEEESFSFEAEESFEFEEEEDTVEEEESKKSRKEKKAKKDKKAKKEKKSFSQRFLDYFTVEVDDDEDDEDDDGDDDDDTVENTSYETNTGNYGGDDDDDDDDLNFIDI